MVLPALDPSGNPLCRQGMCLWPSLQNPSTQPWVPLQHHLNPCCGRHSPCCGPHWTAGRSLTRSVLFPRLYMASHHSSSLAHSSPPHTVPPARPTPLLPSPAAKPVPPRQCYLHQKEVIWGGALPFRLNHHLLQDGTLSCSETCSQGPRQCPHIKECLKKEHQGS